MISRIKKFLARLQQEGDDDYARRQGGGYRPISDGPQGPPPSAPNRQSVIYVPVAARLEILREITETMEKLAALIARLEGRPPVCPVCKLELQGLVCHQDKCPYR